MFFADISAGKGLSICFIQQGCTVSRRISTGFYNWCEKTIDSLVVVMDKFHGTEVVTFKFTIVHIGFICLKCHSISVLSTIITHLLQIAWHMY